MQIDRETLRTLRDEINAALAAVGAKHGLKLSAGSASFSELQATFKLEVRQSTTEGASAVLEKQADDYRAYAVAFGADPTWLHKSYRRGGHSFTVVGIEPGRPKNCIKLQRDDGKGFICSPTLVRMYMGA